MKQKILILLGILILSATILVYGDYQTFMQAPVSETVLFNGQALAVTGGSIEGSLIFGLIPLKRSLPAGEPQILTTETLSNTLSLDPDATVTLSAPDGTQSVPESPETLEFPTNGTWTVEVKDPLAGGSFVLTRFTVEVKLKPIIEFSNLSVSQGGLILADLSNLPAGYTLEVKSAFKPSAILKQAHSARFYLPIGYLKDAKDYPLSLILDQTPYDYTVQVTPEDFKIIRFTVSATVSKATVGNPEATPQFRSVIYPTYESAVNEEYWSGPFTVPVRGAKITSTFGEMRYVNDAKTPSRHAGIDYAIACGTEVTASNAGKVEVAQFLILTGNTVVIDHGLGLKTYYEHMDDLQVKAGDIVAQDQLIGHVGTTGYSTGCHLHFQAMVMGQSINPEGLYKLSP